MDAKRTDRLIDIENAFDKSIHYVLHLLKARVSDDEESLVEVEHLDRILRLCPVREKIMRCSEKIWRAREHIIAQNADYFLNRKYDEYIKRDANQEFIENIVRIVQQQYRTLSQREREILWQQANIMLKCVVDYRLNAA